MPALPLNQPVATEAPTLVVEDAREPGTYVYTLVVEDASGNLSDPVKVTVKVVPRAASGGG